MSRKAIQTRRRGRGFTLLELLVVIAIFAVLAGTVMVSFTGADEERRLRALAEGIQTRLEMARQNALQRNREWGVHVQENGYRFSEFDPQLGTWTTQTQRPFQAAKEAPRIEFDVEVEGFELGQFSTPEDEEEDLPDIVLFSSGEVTPFTWVLQPDWDTIPWVLHSDGLAAVTAEREDVRWASGGRRNARGGRDDLAHLFTGLGIR